MKAYHFVDKPPLFTNCFLLIGDNNNAVAIDPAAPAAEFERVLEQNGATLTHILLTHGHFDHIGSVEPLRAKYGAKLYMNKADAEHFELKADGFFEDGGTMQVDDMTFTTIFTPGHTPGSTCIRCYAPQWQWGEPIKKAFLPHGESTADLMFTGDTLFEGDIGRTDLPGGSSAEMGKSLRKLRDVITDDVQVLPGHEEFSTFMYEREHNPYLRA